MSEKNTASLNDAPADIKLAVDLIYLLETNEIDPKTALSALEIVKSDLLAKLKKDNSEQ
ncbi:MULTISPECIES: pleiotropic regulatory protein RsmS [Photobacterium]|uniref:Primosomal protein n=1 Tax=Photobacterium ganghwense TaxID=320778 RepID=A0A0J1JQ06_9GAMM|nr:MULTISPECIES: pleiotropic regulatory protein RsmS [Photobacterium]KLV04317.1 primosomal protein [Photobacterium ganghwense]MBV1840916.1 pleiotropic regulatory protein RsmS [Photobacterium ganghwense]PSU08057.1 primosomal protein [Photobacterium ganghwense]QSV14866.1 pleiotropic regulatory protein RsmS [Photobacterium ganghwense]